MSARSKTKKKGAVSSRKNREQIARIFLLLVATLLSAILIGRTVSRGDDFQVFHQVAQRFWDGVRPYDSITYGNMIFKYPPWILPVFLPFGALDLTTAKIVWGAIEAFSLGAIIVRLHHGFGKLPAVRPAVQGLFLLVFFALFGSHGMTGQITLPTLAIALWVDPIRGNFSRFFALVWVLSAKLISLFPLAHALKRRKLLSTVCACFGLFLILSLPVYFKSYDSHYKAMKVEWTAALFSGTEDVENVRIGFTTREAQGLPSLILRKTGLDEKEPVHILSSIAFSVLLLGLVWGWFSRKLTHDAQWIGWLALLPVVQPLSWFHVFLFAYPIFVVGAEMALRLEERRRAIAIFVCALLVGAITPKTMGALGAALEFWSIKLWGVLGALWIFWRLLRGSVEVRRK